MCVCVGKGTSNAGWGQVGGAGQLHSTPQRRRYKIYISYIVIFIYMYRDGDGGFSFPTVIRHEDTTREQTAVTDRQRERERERGGGKNQCCCLIVRLESCLSLLVVVHVRFFFICRRLGGWVGGGLHRNGESGKIPVT